MPPSHRKHIVVAYHKDCLDGLASAWAVGKKHEQDEGIEIDYVAFGHHEQETAENTIAASALPGSVILFVDVAPRAEFVKRLISPGSSFIEVIDHHKSAHDNLNHISAPNLKLNIDPDHPSAAHMVWEAMHGSTPRPPFFDMIARMDVKTDLTTHQDFSAAAYIDSKSIRSIDDAFRSFESLHPMTYDDMAIEGSVLYEDQRNRIAKLDDNVMYTRIDHPAVKDKWIPVVNADVQNFGRAISAYLRDLGQKTGSDSAFAWYMQGNGKVTMSIRSDGSPDASGIAKHLCHSWGIEGGGHVTSAAVHFKSLGEFFENIQLTSLENI